MATSTYTYGLVYGDIEARIGEAEIDGSSVPTSVQVTTWIGEAAGAINSEIESVLGDVDLSTTFTANANANQYQRIRHHIAQRVVSLWWAANQRDAPSWVTSLDDAWREALTDVRELAQRFLGAAAPDTVKSHVRLTSELEIPTKLKGADRWFN